MQQFFGFLLVSLALLGYQFASAQPAELLTPYERSEGTQTATYNEAIAFYEALRAAYPEQVRRVKMGLTDCGKPLMVYLFSAEGRPNVERARAAGDAVLLIQNGIHPGEPEGVDASMLFARELLTASDNERLRGLLVAIIPIYNIGGALNRSCCSRANQQGPQAYGFRGNRKNLDLNRDYIKQDSRNAQEFARLFRWLNPDLFLDTHTSNGADYQHVFTLIETQHNKLGGVLGDYLHHRFTPALYDGMAEAGWEMAPYVMTRKGIPDSGLVGYLETPRYSSGYAALFGSLAFVPETHMLKPFAERMQATLAFLKVSARLLQQERETIRQLREEQTQFWSRQTHYPIGWELDTTRCDSFFFRGYTASDSLGELTGLSRRYYNRDKPWQDSIANYCYYRISKKVRIPYAYVIPQAYEGVIRRLSAAGVTLKRVPRDTLISGEGYYIRSEETVNTPYESHYLHYNTIVEAQPMELPFYSGDYIVATDGDNLPYRRLLLETLEPHAPDSYFAWNFFDGILMQKEHFSRYVFEAKAAQWLTEHPELRAELEERKASDEEFANDARAQLDFVYKRSPWYEPTHRRYPVLRLVDR